MYGLQSMYDWVDEPIVVTPKVEPFNIKPYLGRVFSVYGFSVRKWHVKPHDTHSYLIWIVNIHNKEDSYCIAVEQFKKDAVEVWW